MSVERSVVMSRRAGTRSRAHRGSCPGAGAVSGDARRRHAARRRTSQSRRTTWRGRVRRSWSTATGRGRSAPRGPRNAARRSGGSTPRSWPRRRAGVRPPSSGGHRAAYLPSESKMPPGKREEQGPQSAATSIPRIPTLKVGFTRSCAPGEPVLHPRATVARAPASEYSRETGPLHRSCEATSRRAHRPDPGRPPHGQFRPRRRKSRSTHRAHGPRWSAVRAQGRVTCTPSP